MTTQTTRGNYEAVGYQQITNAAAAIGQAASAKINIIYYA